MGNCLDFLRCPRHTTKQEKIMGAGPVFLLFARKLQMESFIFPCFSKHKNWIKKNNFIHSMTVYATNSLKKQIFRFPFP